MLNADLRSIRERCLVHLAMPIVDGSLRLRIRLEIVHPLAVLSTVHLMKCVANRRAPSIVDDAVDVDFESTREQRHRDRQLA
jgi:hypothetical protein